MILNRLTKDGETFGRGVIWSGKVREETHKKETQIQSQKALGKWVGTLTLPPSSNGPTFRYQLLEQNHVGMMTVGP